METTAQQQVPMRTGAYMVALKRLVAAKRFRPIFP
jgi:glutamate dehydrogenase/leucine dehydrogenase